MPDLLLELYSEEIPAAMQPRAEADLKRLVTDAAVAAGLTYAHAGAFSTPRRLTLHIEGLAAESPARREYPTATRSIPRRNEFDSLRRSAARPAWPPVGHRFHAEVPWKTAF